MDSEAKRRLKQTLVVIILLVVFLYLIIYIAGMGVSIFRENKKETDSIAEVSFECTTYVFEIIGDSIKYEEGKLEFLIRNSIGEPFDYLIVNSDGKEYKFLLDEFEIGSAPILISLEGIAGDSVNIYPQGCTENKKILKLT